MISSFMRKSILALAAVASFGVVAPAFSNDFDEPEIIYSEQRQYSGNSTHRNERPRNYLPRHELRRHILSEREIASALRHQGFRHIQEIDFRGETYRVIAVRHNGAVVKLRVSASSGRVIAESRIGWSRSVRSHEDNWPRRHSNGSGVTLEFGWGHRY